MSQPGVKGRGRFIAPMVAELVSPHRRARRPSSRPGQTGMGALAVVVVVLLAAAGLLPENVIDAALDRAGAAGGALVVGDIRVTDGDTIRIGAERIRIENLDTPELGDGAECLAERLLADRARDAAAGMFAAAGEVRIARAGHDRYGRTLARVSLDGADFGDAMVRAGYARPWTGRRVDWCAA